MTPCTGARGAAETGVKGHDLIPGKPMLLQIRRDSRRVVFCDPLLLSLAGVCRPDTACLEAADLVPDTCRVRLNALLESLSPERMIDEFTYALPAGPLNYTMRWILTLVPGTAFDTVSVAALADDRGDAAGCAPFTDRGDGINALLEASKAGIIAIDATGHITYANSSFNRMTGFAPPTGPRLHYLDIVHPSEREAARRSLDSLLEGAERYAEVLERRYCRADGSDYWGLASAGRITMADGSTGHVIIITDITSRRINEEINSRLYRLSLALNDINGLDEAMERVMEVILSFENVSAAGIYLCDREGRDIVLRRRGGSDPGGAAMESVIEGGSLKGDLIRGGAPFTIDIEQGAYPGAAREGAALSLNPVTHRGEVIGALTAVYCAAGGIPAPVRDALETMGRQIGGAIVRIRAEDSIRDSLAEKEVLIKEIHHRVKNNMQIISSFLGLQCEKIRDGHYRDLFVESQNRIQTMAILHEKLYRSENLAEIDFNSCIHDIVANLMLSHRADPSRIRARISADGVRLGIDTAVPCAEILNELVTNSLKYAFPGGRSGTVTVEMGEKDGRYVLVVADDGVGLARQGAPDGPVSLGLTIVYALADQLKGSIDLDESKGTRYTIVF